MVAGCGGGGADTTPARSTTTPRSQRAGGPALCRRLSAGVTGHVTTPQATELSGLVLSRSQGGVLWAMNDSGNAPRVFAFAPDGRLRADLRVTGAANVDWEDIALGPAASAGGVLYIADIGDNAEQRPDVAVYSTPEPRLGPGPAAHGATAPAQRLTLRYPDGAHDAEALILDGATGTIAIATKSFDGTARLYVTHRRASREPVTLRRAGKLSLGPGEAITAGDISADGATVVLRSYDRAYVYERRGGEPLSRTFRRRPCVAGADLTAEGQGEALALAADGGSFYTVPEGRRPAIRRYAPTR